MAEYFDAFDRDAFAEYIREVTTNPHGELIFIRGYDGKPVGCLTVLLSQEGGRRVGWIYDVAVAGAERDRNYGDVLVGLAVDWASYRGANPVVLDSRPNLGARHRPGDPRPFDPDDPSLFALGLSKAIEYGRQASYGLDPR